MKDPDPKFPATTTEVDEDGDIVAESKKKKTRREDPLSDMERNSLEEDLSKLRLDYTNHRLQQRHKVPVLTSPKRVTPPAKPKYTRHFKALLEGVRDPTSPLSMFAGYEDSILKEIYTYAYYSWEACLEHTLPSTHYGRFELWTCPNLVGEEQDVVQADRREQRLLPRIWRRPIAVENVLVKGYQQHDILGPLVSDRPAVAYHRLGGRSIQFPPPTGRHVTMLPFVLGRRDSLPAELQPYYSLISQCPVHVSELRQVCYLTVREGKRSNANDNRIQLAQVPMTSQAQFAAGVEHHWGIGQPYTSDEYHGGMYMATSGGTFIQTWNTMVDDDIRDSFEIDEDLEHLRPFLGEPNVIPTNELIWMTNLTPFQAQTMAAEAECQESDEGTRQLFQLITSKISYWDSSRNTPNPMVDIPSCVRTTST